MLSKSSLQWGIGFHRIEQHMLENTHNNGVVLLKSLNELSITTSSRYFSLTQFCANMLNQDQNKDTWITRFEGTQNLKEVY